MLALAQRTVKQTISAQKEWGHRVSSLSSVSSDLSLQGPQAPTALREGR